MYPREKKYSVPQELTVVLQKVNTSFQHYLLSSFQKPNKTWKKNIHKFNKLMEHCLGSNKNMIIVKRKSHLIADFAIGLVIFVLNLPDRQVLFLGENQIAEGL